VRLIVYSLELRDIFKYLGATAMMNQDVYKTATEGQMMSEYYKEETPPGHLIQSTTHTKASSTWPEYFSMREDK
jgi:hypothetical protein